MKFSDSIEQWSGPQLFGTRESLVEDRVGGEMVGGHLACSRVPNRPRTSNGPRLGVGDP